MSATSMAMRASGETTATGFKSSLQTIAAYIPSEGLAVYLAAQGLLIPAKDATTEQQFRLRLVCFGIGLIVVVFLAFAAFDGSKFKASEARRRRGLVTLLSAVAFAIYGSATPQFFLSDQSYLTIAWSQYAALVTIISALVIPYVANALKAFRAGLRKDPMMAGVARGLSDTDIVNLAAYYAEQGCAPTTQARSTP